ncbi:pentapeptide repeat-containing protein [Modestobacter sp. Leaf380]|uniref:pentapeptide repeat-containing protein n=1 Tax=Modestobacter sp. Leaf380 TaxID=1736356 RepID=UPI001F292E5C|nr:pentapeptide repeat-containing protein [Modestobacter sp. Leaf380]
MSVSIVVLGGLTLVGLATVGIWLVYGRPDFQQVDAVSPGGALDAIKVSAGLVAGVGAAVALVVAYRKQRLGEEEHRLQEESSQRDANRLFNERFARASDQIGSERAAVRLAGIYAMAGLADDWHEGRQTCIDVLCAYLRMPFAPRGPLPTFDQPEYRRPRPWEMFIGGEPVAGPNVDAAGEAQVRTTVIQVLRDHLVSEDGRSWQGAEFDFTGSVLEDASFDGIIFSDCHVRFDDCLFVGECGFSQTTFRRSDVSFLNAVFAGRLGFEYSKFEESDITFYGDFTEKTDANFQGASLTSGTLRILGPRKHGGSVSFVEADFSGGVLELNPSMLHDGASIAFSRAKISGTDVRILGGEHKAGSIWCNGIDMTAGSFIFGAAEWSQWPVRLEGTEFSFDGARVSGGEIALRHVLIDGSDVHFENFEMLDGRLNIASCEVDSGTLRFLNPVMTGGEVVMLESQRSGPLRAVTAASQAGGARLIAAATDDISPP